MGWASTYRLGDGAVGAALVTTVPGVQGGPVGQGRPLILGGGARHGAPPPPPLATPPRGDGHGGARVSYTQLLSLVMVHW